MLIPFRFKIGIHNEDNRIAWVKKTLQKIPKGKKILDAGAGEQLYRQYCSHLKYIAQDFAEYNGLGNNQGLQTKKWDYGKLDIVSDIISIPLPNYSLDAILCSEVFEHIPEPIFGY